MTIKISLDDLRARVEARRRQRHADRDAALRARGVTVMPRRTYSKTIQATVARVLPWRRRGD